MTSHRIDIIMLPHPPLPNGSWSKWAAPPHLEKRNHEEKAILNAFPSQTPPTQSPQLGIGIHMQALSSGHYVSLQPHWVLQPKTSTLTRSLTGYHWELPASPDAASTSLQPCQASALPGKHQHCVSEDVGSRASLPDSWPALGGAPKIWGSPLHLGPSILT